MLPELLIVSSIMTNEIIMRLMGLHYQIEEDLENLEESIHRTISDDKEALMFEKKIRANMAMSMKKKTQNKSNHQQTPKILLSKNTPKNFCT